jgi:hypothetical protein
VFKNYWQILTFNGDNATSNDKQTTALDKLPNSFDATNHVQCFNHTIQLSAKALLKPFSASPKDNNESNNDDEDLEEGPEIHYEDPEDDRSNNNDNDNKEEEEEDPLDELDEEAHEQLLEDTVVVHTTLNKVCIVIFCCL